VSARRFAIVAICLGGPVVEMLLNRTNVTQVNAVSVGSV
jgi:hypothetical protein